jgi:hypothetical protein
MTRVRVLCSFLLLFVGFLCSAQVQSNQQTASQDSAAAAQKVPVIDGGAGPCSLELVVTADSKPVYAAAVKVHIAYGFGGVRKLDLEASTNIDGKVKFIGLPSRVRRPPLEFQASKDQLLGTATYDPDSECQAKHDIALEKASPQQSQ